MRYAIYFLHAFPLSSEMWINQIQYFQKKARVVAMDYPGFGGTDDSVIPNNPSIDDFAKFVEGIIQKTSETSDKIVLVGLSMGGYIAQYIVRRKIVVVDYLVLANTRSKSDTDEIRKTRLELIDRAKKENSLRPILDFYVPALSGENEKLKDEVVRIASRTKLSGATKALWAIAYRDDMTDVVRSFPKDKLLIIAGSNDKLSPPDVMIDMATDPANQLKVIDSGHLSALEKPDVFNKLLDDFLF
ncbi:MAG: alpha/beta hydrolase [Candidatus Calescibacterium sp.]|nr:alpha/beta hydrolase [Candidatus Calescibacterium sp.]MCX7734600.1 alpha/beta hydrolase [bacterium]MDW8086609.1 alpha/beta hydrolase [Candidatus Calescibacterium sp.]